jgi:hypothetical protein
MSAHFMAQIYAWSLGLGFLLVFLLIIIISVGVADGKIKSNPVTPFIRAYERRQAHRYRMQELKLRVQLAKTGVDPEYVTFMEEKSKT